MMSVSDPNHSRYNWQVYDNYNSGVTDVTTNHTSIAPMWYTDKFNASFTAGKGYNYFSYAFLQCVSVNLGANARKSFVAYLGVNLADKGLYLWVVNTADATNCTPQKITDFSYILQRDNDGGFTDKMRQYTAKNYFSITAGDYDGDGRDSLVVGYNRPIFNTSGTLTGWQSCAEEYQYNSGKFDGTGGWNIATWGSGPTSLECIPCVDVSTGDYDGDGTDDLAILGYNMTYNSTYTQPCPELAILKGSTGKNIDFSDVLSAHVRSGGTDIDTNNITMFAPSVCSGDINGDGRDEAVVSGYAAHYERTATSETTYFLDQDEGIGVAAYNLVSGQMNQMLFAKTAMNDFTYDGLYENMDTIWQQLQGECIALNGQQAAENLFVGGTLYSLGASASGYALNAVYTPDYFTSKDSGHTNAYIETITVGNLDSNSIGREQAVFTMALKHAGNENYDYKTAILGGLYSDGYTTSEVDGKTQVTSVPAQAGHYYCSLADGDSQYTLTDAAAGGAGVYTNCLPCAVDIEDNDGLMLEYTGKGFVYSDPIVEAILQAAPYYGGVQSSGATTYEVDVDYTNGTGSSDNVSLETGLTSEFEAGLELTFKFKSTVELGYTMDKTWSKEVAYTTSSTKSFSASSQNTVLVQRTPSVVYSYDVVANGKRYEYAMSVAVPQAPVWSQMTVSEYNKFVDKYNTAADAANKKTGLKEGQDGYCYPLLALEDNDKKITDTGEYLINNEGNPAGYLHGWGSNADIHAESLAADPVKDPGEELAYNGGTASRGWATSTENTDTYEVARGFHYGFSMGGGMGVVVSASISAYLNVDYNHGSTTYTSKTDTTGVNGLVSNLDAKSLRENSGLSDATIYAYYYRWAFGRWKVSLGAEKSGNHEVSVYGYSVTDLSSPPAAVTDLALKNNTGGTVLLGWTDPETRKADTGTYNIYQIVDGKHVLLNAAPQENLTSYTLDAAQLDTTSSNLCTFVVTRIETNSAGTKLESVWSNEVVYVVGMGGSSAYDLAVKNGFVGTEAEWLASLTGAKGDAGNGVAKIEKTATDGLLDTYTITFTNGDTTSFTMANGAEGRGITAVAKTNTEGTTDTYTITYTDGTTSSFMVKNGEKGEKGTAGTAGADEAGGISDVTLDEDGNLIVTLADGRTMNAGSVKLSAISDDAVPTAGGVRAASSSRGITVLWLLAVLSLLWNAALTVAFIKDQRSRRTAEEPER